MRKLTVVGMGPGSQSCLTLEALEALRKADLIVGAGRLLETLPEGCSKNRKIAVSAQAAFYSAVYTFGRLGSFPFLTDEKIIFLRHTSWRYRSSVSAGPDAENHSPA